MASKMCTLLLIVAADGLPIKPTIKEDVAIAPTNTSRPLRRLAGESVSVPEQCNDFKGADGTINYASCTSIDKEITCVALTRSSSFCHAAFACLQSLTRGCTALAAGLSAGRASLPKIARWISTRGRLSSTLAWA